MKAHSAGASITLIPRLFNVSRATVYTIMRRVSFSNLSKAFETSVLIDKCYNFSLGTVQSCINLL